VRKGVGISHRELKVIVVYFYFAVFEV